MSLQLPFVRVSSEVSFRLQINLESRPDWYPLIRGLIRLNFQQHPRPFHIGEPPGINICLISGLFTP